MKLKLNEKSVSIAILALLVITLVVSVYNLFQWFALNDRINQLNKPLSEIEEMLSDIRNTLKATQPSLQDFIANNAPPPEGYVAIALVFELEDFHVPIEVYEPSQNAKLFDTQTFNTRDLTQIPLISQPPEEVKVIGFKGEKVFIVYVKPGENILLALVAVNPEDHEEKFIALPHSYLPSSAALMVIVKCLCTGETYAIPAEGTWVRIIEIDVSDDIPAGSIVIVTHAIVGQE